LQPCHIEILQSAVNC